MGFFTALLFVAEVRGYSRLYDHSALEQHGGWGFLASSAVLFLLFTDGLIYWIHRGLHSKVGAACLHALAQALDPSRLHSLCIFCISCITNGR